MGNHASSGERRHKGSDAYPMGLPARMEGQAFNIDRHKAQRLATQQSEEESALVIGKSPKSQHENKENTEISSSPRPVLNPENKKMLPCVIKWNGGGKDVALAGSFNNWRTLPMVKSEKDFVAIVDLPEGHHEYKFLVDGEWKVSVADKACTNPMGTENNILTVKESDFEELENALLRDPNDKKESPYGVSSFGFLKTDAPVDKEEYSQEIPETSPSEKKKGPPVLPPHLLQVILNKDTPVSCEPTLLPEPNHVMLNHMYALSIRDGMMVLSTSHRYRKKCVTTLIYRPI
ncbi:5'-AMP-activated protein kinase subunit beta-1 [Armadillidium nasatum]|uniref:5'-AMP-activated protein kinase subunit beta-1 n=1 Tax=Armadillidium nasatum TaxID=96803 RepID=A0A5N5TII1_9CRUS|nr:5'-AMP-activated protein kinase subunit beta-1 [Armadillidium nasatum]KAB7504800.1 5'-AMP-activated protein kinase subunit beta-1 [Armadillidium nasatum]